MKKFLCALFLILCGFSLIGGGAFLFAGCSQSEGGLETPEDGEMENPGEDGSDTEDDNNNEENEDDDILAQDAVDFSVRITAFMPWNSGATGTSYSELNSNSIHAGRFTIYWYEGDGGSNHGTTQTWGNTPTTTAAYGYSVNGGNSNSTYASNLVYFKYNYFWGVQRYARLYAIASGGYTRWSINTSSSFETSRQTTGTSTYSYIYRNSQTATSAPSSSVGTSMSGNWYIKIRRNLTLEYDANGGSGAPGDQSFYAGRPVTLSDTIPTRTGYTFTGWRLQYIGETMGSSFDIYDAGDTIPWSDITLSTEYRDNNDITGSYEAIAQWEVNSYSIRVYAMTGIVDINQPATSWYSNSIGRYKEVTATYGSEYTIAVTADTHYSFSKWTTTNSSSASAVSTSSTYTFTVDTSNTYYAWAEIDTHTLTVRYYGGTTRQSNTTNLEVNGTAVSTGGSTTISHAYSTTAQSVTITLSNGSYDYYMRTGSNPTTSTYTKLYDSSSDSYTYSWTPDSNDTLYVYVKQRYTITYNSNGGSGDLPTSDTYKYKIHGTALTLGTNNLKKTSYTANGWNTNSAGTGTAYSSGGSYSTNASDTLYADWTPRTATIRVQIKTSTNGSTFSNSVTGGTTTVRYYYDNNNTATQSSSVSVTSASATTVATNALLSRAVTFTPTANSGYVYLGVTTSSTTIPSNRSTTITPTATGTYTCYLYFKVTSSFELKYDSTERYWYFENGVFPQSYVGTSMNSTLTTAYSNGNTTQSGRIQYNNGSSTVYIYLYTYNSNRYARVQATSTQTLTMSNGTFTFNSGTYYWFEVEPIRWRLSNYGVSSTSYPSGWSTFGTYKTNFSVVSDRVLMIGAVETSSVTEGWAYTSSDLYTNTSRFNNNASTTNFSAGVSYGSVSGYNYKFGAAGQQVKVESVSSSLSGIRVASIEEIDGYTSDFSAKASDMVCLLLGCGTDEFVDYWTRNLGTGLGNGQIITKAGEEKSTWLNTLKGVRFAVTMPSGSRV